MAAGDAERRRIERNLHDGAQQRLVTVALHLHLVKRRLETDPGEVSQLVESAQTELALALKRSASSCAASIRASSRTVGSSLR